MLYKSLVSGDSRAFSGSRGQVVSCRKVLHWENPPLAYSLWCGCRVPCIYIHQQTKPFPTNPDLLSSSPNSGWGRNILYKQCLVQILLGQSWSWESSEHAQLYGLNSNLKLLIDSNELVYKAFFMATNSLLISINFRTAWCLGHVSWLYHILMGHSIYKQSWKLSTPTYN